MKLSNHLYIIVITFTISIIIVVDIVIDNFFFSFFKVQV